jgi:subfamily B ATP-binding cassette protein MsbA
VEETLTGFRIIKGFGLEQKVSENFDKLNNSLRRLNNSMTRKRELSSPLTEFLASFVIAIVMFYGGNLVFNKELEPATFIFYIVVFSQIIPPAKAISTTFYNIQKGAASLDRIEEILNEDEKINNIANAEPIDSLNEYLEFKNVKFQYKDEPVLKNINLRIEKGKSVALVGQSGAGKSTLVDLLPRFYDVSEGVVNIDGKDIKSLKIEDLRNLMGIVPQHSILFNDSIAANIAISEDSIDMNRVIEAAKVANAYDFIMQFPDGFETNIGDSGSKLSGGQRQRIAIARAVYKNPPILILDEATSALDTESERLVQDALVKVMKGKTSIVIAHRLSTIQHSDEIIVMQDGEIVERGTHNNLIKENGVYQKLCELQSFR